MKSFVACVLLLVASSSANTVSHPRGCIYILGRCSEECPVGTHAYALGCGYRVPEATCDQPEPVADDQMLCDYSACYCDPPTLRETKTGKCMLKKDCPQGPKVPITTLLPPFEDTKPEATATEASTDLGTDGVIATVAEVEKSATEVAAKSEVATSIETSTGSEALTSKDDPTSPESPIDKKE